MTTRVPTPARAIAAVVCDVDGTLVTPDKSLTEAALAAVARLHAAGIAFAVVSSRPPRGMRMLVEPLRLTTPMAGFNGAVFVNAGAAAPHEHFLAPAVARRALDFIVAGGAQPWVFTRDAWLVRDPTARYVKTEVHTVQFAPTAVEDFGAALDGAGKIVAVSEDFSLLAQLEAEGRKAFGAAATVARSQDYYLDFTDPLANKGTALLEFARLLGVRREAIAAIGDGGNDVAMFAQAGLSIAMGNASPEVQAAADLVTASNREDGFAQAVDRYILKDAA
jgi:Cof subfamily protein (haloacid dehalogenase superfamily)